MSSAGSHKQAALAHLRELRRALDAIPPAPAVADVADLAASLERAIDAFHMEAIRFRMFTMGRRLAQVDGVTPEMKARFEQLRSSLEAAGFHTRSVS
jgi:hypothetical protein